MHNDCSVRRLVGYLFWNANNVDMSLKILMYFTYLHIIIILAIAVYIYMRLIIMIMYRRLTCTAG